MMKKMIQSMNRARTSQGTRQAKEHSGRRPLAWGLVSLGLLPLLGACTIESSAPQSAAPAEPEAAAITQSTPLTPPSNLITFTLDDGSEVIAAHDQVILAFAPSAGAHERQLIDDLLIDFGATVIGEIPEFRLLQVEVDETQVLKLHGRLNQESSLAYASLNLLQMPEKLEGLTFDGQAKAIYADAYWAEDIYLEGAWAITTGTPETPIAIVDTGLDLRSGHFDPAMVTQLYTPRVDADRPDFTGHGTMVSALAAASGSGTTGMTGIAQRNPIISVDITNALDGSSTLDADLMGLLQAMRAQAPVILFPRGPHTGEHASCVKQNLELAYQEYRWLISPAIAYARQSGALVITPAAEALSEADKSCRPGLKRDDAILPAHRQHDASYADYEAAWLSNALIVASTNASARASDYSAEGLAITLAAPGETLPGATPDGTIHPVTGNAFAAAIAAGSAALVHGALDGEAYRTKQVLQLTGQSLSSDQVGSGLIDVEKAVEQALVEKGASVDGIDANQSDMQVSGFGVGDRMGGVHCLGDLNSRPGSETGLSSHRFDNEKGALFIFLGDESQAAARNADDADVTLFGETPGSRYGWDASNIGDFDGNGEADFAVSAPFFNSPGYADTGRVYIYRNRSREEWIDWFVYPEERSRNIHIIEGLEADQRIGYSLTGGQDLNSDGYTELILGTPGTENQRGAVHIFLGRETPSVYAPITTADIILEGEAEGDEAGYQVGFAGDLDGDGRLEMVVGAPGHDQSGDNAGKVYLYLSSTLANLSPGVHRLADADYAFLGEGRGDRVGESVALLGDIDRDGLSDFAIGSPHHDATGIDAGAVYVFKGASRATWSQRTPLAFADHKLLGEGPGDQAGASLSSSSADYTGDTDEWMVGAPNHAGGRGAVYVFDEMDSSVCPHSINLGTLGIKVIGSHPGDKLGTSIDGTCDFDADQKWDYLLAAPGAYLSRVTDTGVVHIFRGPTSLLRRKQANYKGNNTISCNGSGQAPQTHWGWIALLALAFLGRRSPSPRCRPMPMLLALLTLGGCAVGPTPSALESEPEPILPSDTGEGFHGTVYTQDDEALAGASISYTLEGETYAAISDDGGHFDLPWVSRDDALELIIQIEHPLHLSNRRRVDVAPGQGGASLNLILPRTHIRSFNAEVGAHLAFEDFALTFPAHALSRVDDPHMPISGPVDIMVAEYLPGMGEPLPVPTLEAYAEGSNSGQLAKEEANPPTGLLSTLGMVGVELYQDGLRLDVVPNAEVGIEIMGAASRYLNPHNQNQPYIAGDTGPLFYLGESDLIWQLYDGEGWMVDAASDGSDSLSFYAQVPHFTYWNLDVFVPATKLVGQVFTRTQDGIVTYAGVEVNVRGYNNSGGEWHTYGWTDPSGNYCIRVGADTSHVEIWFEADFDGHHYKVSEQTSTTAVSSEPSCADAEASIHNHEIPCEWMEAHAPQYLIP